MIIGRLVGVPPGAGCPKTIRVTPIGVVLAE